MLWGSYSRETLRMHFMLSFLFSFHLSTVVGANGDVAHPHNPLTTTAPHLSYNCQEGANVTLLCAQRGAKLHRLDHLYRSWLFTPNSSEHCHSTVHPRGHHQQGSHSHVELPWGVQYGASEESFWVQLQFVNITDQGRYCCLSLEINHGKVVQKTHSHVILIVTPWKRGHAKCTVLGTKPPEVSSVTAGLATAACIMAILSLPCILVLVYKQRQSAQSSRRAHELVRMDSEAAGYENPVFLGDSPPGQAKTRTVSQIMTRQSSETGRHLLMSDPGTPLSPPAHGAVFFPDQEPILESPDVLQV